MRDGWNDLRALSGGFGESGASKKASLSAIALEEFKCTGLEGGHDSQSRAFVV